MLLMVVTVAVAPVAGAAPSAPAVVQTVAPRVYVTNNGSNSVSALDPATNTVVATVAVGARPTGVAVSPDGTRVYVVNSASVSVLDTVTNTVVATIGVGGGATDIAFSPDGTRAYVTDSEEMFVIDTANNNVVAVVPMGVVIPNTTSVNDARPVAVVVSADGTRVYVINPEQRVAVSQGGPLRYVPGSVRVIDTASYRVVATLQVPFLLSDVALSPDGTHLYVTARVGFEAGFGPARVFAIDTATNGFDAFIPVPDPTAVAAAPDGSRVYATSPGKPTLVPGGDPVPNPGTVSVIDPVTAAVAATVPVGLNPSGVAVSSDSSRAYVANADSGTVSVIDTATDLVVATVAVGSGPTGVAITPGAPRPPPSCSPSGVGAGTSRSFINRLDADTSTIDRSVGQWVPWFSTRVAPSAASPQGCSHSLKVDITAPYGWGVQLGNFPGFAATPGAHVIGFWGRSANPGLAATMTVTWRNASRAVLGTDRVSLPLTGTLTHAATVAFAPPGTAFAYVDFTNASGNAGNTVYLDDISVTPVPSALGADTATLEGGKGEWAPWFSTNVAQSAEQAHGGTRSLKVDITAPYGWGVQLRNYPGFATGPSAHVIGFWGRSAAPGLSATMAVTWRDAAGAEVGTDRVTLPLTDGWTQVSVLAFAPPGTAFADVHVSGASGQPGDTVFLDDITVISVPSVIGRDTSTIEGPDHRWVPWYATNVSRSTAQAHSGTSSLKVDVTGPYGWGVQLRNFPGFATTPGLKTIGFWGRSPSPGLAATMTVRWRDASGVPLATNQLTLALGDSWAQAMTTATAPPGTARVTVEFSSPSGPPGSTIYLDDIIVVDANLAALTPG